MIPAPEGFVVRIFGSNTGAVTYRAIAFDDDGLPLIESEQTGEGLITPNEIYWASKWFMEDAGSAPLIPTEPGWVLTTIEHHDDESYLYRYPVVAWRPSLSQFTGNATIVAEEGPVDAGSTLHDASNVSRLGYFHPEHRPEPDFGEKIATYRSAYLKREEDRRKSYEEQLVENKT